MKMNWLTFALKVPALIQGGVEIVNSIKHAKGSEKKQKVLDSIASAIDLAEFAAGRDLLNDPAIAQLVSAAIDAEAAALKARDALREGLLARAAPTPPPA